MASFQEDLTLSEGNLLPRLATSRQWTPLPSELLSKVEAIFKDQFDIEAENGEFVVEGRIYTQELIVRVGYLESGRLRQINFEASMDIKPASETEPTVFAQPESEEELEEDGYFGSAEELEVDGPLDTYEGEAKASLTMQLLFVAIDALGSAMEEFFDLADEDAIDIPITWRPYDFEGSKVYLQHSTVNSRLEDEADKILMQFEQKGPRLYNEPKESEDALAKAQIDSDLALEVQRLIREGKFPLMGDGPRDEGHEDEI